MKKISIYTDSCSDISNTLAEEKNITVLPIYYHFDNENIEYGNNNALSQSEFFEKMKTGGIPHTASCNPEVIYNKFEQDVLNGNDIICINISSNLSSSYNNCIITAEMIKGKYPNANIKVIDSTQGSLSEGLMVMEAVEMREENKSYKEIVEQIEYKKQFYNIEFFINDLKFLHQGGRLSKTKTIVGTALGVKPLIGLTKDGSVTIINTIRGVRNMIPTLVERWKENNASEKIVGIVHSDSKEQASELQAELKKLKAIKKIVTSEITPTIASHIGPGGIGLVYQLKQKRI